MASSMNAVPSLRWLVSLSIARKSEKTGLLMPAEKRGFCRSSAARSVEPARGRPEMKSVLHREFNHKREGSAERRRTFIAGFAVSRYAPEGSGLRLRRRPARPRPAKPAAIIAQVDGSGTADMGETVKSLLSRMSGEFSEYKFSRRRKSCMKKDAFTRVPPSSPFSGPLNEYEKPFSVRSLEKGICGNGKSSLSFPA